MIESFAGASSPSATNLTPEPNQPQQPWFKRHWKPLAVAGAVVILAGSSALAWNLLRPKPAPNASVTASPKATPTPTPAPITKASPLTGTLVAPELANRPIVSVIVENHPDARPQSGLQSAGVVYEALAEGGITRFQTFFLEGQPTALGPVRSLRPYFVDWGLEFGAPVAHAGGSSTALDMVGPTGLRSLNALVIGAPTFYRLSSRVAPHNLYTSSSLLDGLLSKRGFNQPASFTPNTRKADTPVSGTPHPNITINYSYNSFQAGYTYDTNNNNYARSIAGAPHKDALTGQQIKVKNIVVEYMPTSTLSDGHMQMTTVGRGDAIVFRDGDAIKGTWVKASRNARTQLIGADSKEIPLNAGNTWYSIVPIGKTVSY